MDNFTLYGIMKNLQNATLARSKRSNSFLQIKDSNTCYYPRHFDPNASEMCRYVENTPSCSDNVYYIDYLHLLFCTLKLPWNQSYIFVLVIYLAILYSVLHLIVKYFALPNYMTLMEMLPISPFVYSYVYFGIVLLLPDYISIWLSCNHVGSYYSTLILSRTIGDVMRYFILGVMMLCYRGYQINWELLWGNISCIFVGFVYLLHVVRTKYYLFGRHDLPYNDSHTMTLNGWSFLVTFTLSLIIALVISYHSQNQTFLKTGADQEEESNQYVDMSSDIEITGENPNRTDLSSFQVWWDTVNAFHYMNERRKFITVIFSPLYFILANTIPVISKRRPMHGWCKHVGCISLLAFPFVAIGLKPPPFAWTTVLLISFFIAFNVFISTHPLREPTHMWLRVYSLTGMTMCSITMYALIAEIDNLFWQYFSMNLGPCADTIPLLMASSGVLVVLYVFIDNLMNEGLPDAAYGAVMSVVTHCIYMCLPQLVLHRCYSNHTYIQITDKAQTVAKFFLSMLFTTLFHVSMSGNEFRMSLYYLLLVLFTFHAFLQLSAYYGSVILFGSDSNIQAPLDLSTFWA